MLRSEFVKEIGKMEAYLETEFLAVSRVSEWEIWGAWVARKYEENAIKSSGFEYVDVDIRRRHFFDQDYDVQKIASHMDTINGTFIEFLLDIESRAPVEITGFDVDRKTFKVTIEYILVARDAQVIISKI